MNVKEIKSLPDNSFVQAELEVKTICSSKAHKRHTTDEGEIIQPVILTDNTGDIMAHILCPNNETIGRQWKLFFNGYARKTADGSDLDIISWSTETATEPEPYVAVPDQHYTPAEIEQNGKPDWDRIAKGKTRCNIVCAYIAAGVIGDEGLLGRGVEYNRKLKESIENLIEYIFNGK